MFKRIPLTAKHPTRKKKKHTDSEQESEEYLQIAGLAIGIFFFSSTLEIHKAILLEKAEVGNIRFTSPLEL